MRLGGTVVGHAGNAEEWEALLLRSGFRAVTAPFSCRTPRETIARYVGICEKHDVRIAELGVWKNPFDPDPAKAAEAMAYAKGQLALADELGVACCVNIAGTASAAGWDAADPSNYTAETYARIVRTIREHKRIIFNGNNYSEEWLQEAQRRGLLRLDTTVDALPCYVAEKNIRLFETHQVLSASELRSRMDIGLDAYAKMLNIEAKTMLMMGRREILPAGSAGCEKCRAGSGRCEGTVSLALFWRQYF